MTSPEGGILHETRMLVEDGIVACTSMGAPGTGEHKSEDNDCSFNATHAIESVGNMHMTQVATYISVQNSLVDFVHWGGWNMQPN